MTKREEIVDEINHLSGICNEFHAKRIAAKNRNSEKFGKILPELKYAEFETLETGFSDTIFDVRFRRGPSISINKEGKVTYFSTSSYSSHNVEDKDIDEIINYSEDVFKIFDFFKNNNELVMKTFSEFENIESFYDYPSMNRINELKKRLREMDNAEYSSKIYPEKGKILIYLEEGHHRRGYHAHLTRTIIKVTKTTNKRFTFIRANYEKTGFMPWDETKAIDLDKITLPNEDELELINEYLK